MEEVFALAKTVEQTQSEAELLKVDLANVVLYM